MSKTFLVGGAVRDMLMGVEPHDRDYVVVGATEQEMLDKGFTKVGAAFPVFLHPVTSEEYALARTEVSTGPGYNDFKVVFSPDITLEEDLQRRDLTINAIAFDEESNTYVDPFGFMQDIKDKVIRAVNVRAMEEDPLRIYRAARFLAKLHNDGWLLDVTTLNYMKRGALNLGSLPKERKFAELVKVLGCKTSNLRAFFEVMEYMWEFNTLSDLRGVKQPVQHHPEGDAWTHSVLAAQYTLDHGHSPEVVFASLVHDLGKKIYWESGTLHGHEAAGVPIVAQMCDELGVPNSWKKLAMAGCAEHGRIHGCMSAKPTTVFDLIHRMGGDRKDGGVMEGVLTVATSDSLSRGVTTEYPQADFLRRIASVLRAKCSEESFKKENAEIAAKYKARPQLVADLIRQRKVDIVRSVIEEAK